jgi:hypothetical protein
MDDNAVACLAQQALRGQNRHVEAREQGHMQGSISSDIESEVKT